MTTQQEPHIHSGRRDNGIYAYRVIAYNRDSVFSQDENGELQYATIQGNDVS